MAKDKNELIKDALLFIGNEISDDDLYRQLLDNYEKEWNKLEEQAKSDKATQQQKDDFKRYTEALAKGLPAIATGLRDAIKGFTSNDPFAGSAAVMDICASLASTIGALVSTAGGPPGALVGAIFSIVSMILKLFVKEQKSLTAQLEEIIRTIKSEDKIQELHVAQQAVEAFRNTVTSEGAQWDLADFEVMLNPIEGSTIWAIRGAAEWLEEPKNLDLPLWGQVLAAQCDAHTGLMGCLTIAITGMDISKLPDKGAKNISKLTAVFKSNNPIQLKFLQRIKTLARNRGVVWHIGTFYGNTMDREIYPDSGWLYVRDAMKNPWNQLDKEYHRVVTVSKTKSSNTADPNPYLAVFTLEPVWDHVHYPPNEPYRKNKRGLGLFGKWPLSRHSGWKEIKELNGCYDVWATSGANEHEVYVYAADGASIKRYIHSGEHSEDEGKKLRLSNVKFPMPSGRTVGAVCAVSQPQTHADEEFALLEKEDWVVYAGCEIVIEPLSIAGNYECHQYDNKGSKNSWHYVSISKVNDETFKWTNQAGATWTLTTTTDKTKLAVGNDCPYFAKGYKQATVVRKDNKLDGEVLELIGPNNERFEKSKTDREVRAFFSSGKDGPIMTAFIKMNGMRVDSKYLWVFNQSCIACTTHASVKQYLLNKINAPSWLTYHVPSELFDRGRNFDGLLDLSPCDDGTLVAVFSDTRNDSWKTVNNWNDNKIYYLTPQIDRKAKTLIIEGSEKDDYGHTVKTNGWVKDKDDYKAHRVFKQPIFCWSMIEDLITILQKT